MITRNQFFSLGATVFCAAVGSISEAAAAPIDLTVQSLQVTQGFQNGTTTLVGGRSTMVRVTIDTDSGLAVAGVDAVLRMIVDGVESTDGPYFSMNGPISAPASPTLATLNHTLNFVVVPPMSSQVVFKVVVNPKKTVVETSYANNVMTSSPYNFQCRKIVDLVYVPINYTFGAGLPPADMLVPGQGDNFLRGIYAVGAWDYHRSPLGTLTWNQDVNWSSGALLNALRDIRNVQLPGAGYSQPEFVYGFLPGNPYSGNGLAESTPGTVAFGNSDPNRWQRTFAHEIGHLWGRSHNSAFVEHPSVDVEHHLLDPLGLSQLQSASQRDVMVPGLLTPDAWTAQISYHGCLMDARAQCVPSDAPDGGAPGADARVPCLRVAGVLTHNGRTVELAPFFRLDAATPTIDDPNGDLAVEAIDQTGRVLHLVRLRTDTMRESCGGVGENPHAPIYVLFPEPPAGTTIERVTVRDLTAAAGRPGLAQAGKIVASRERSASAPVVEFVTAAPALGAVAPNGGAWQGTPIEVRWRATDPDGDALSYMVLYSPDGGNRWAPVTVNATGDSTSFDTSDLPAALPGQGLLRLHASDGFTTTSLDGSIDWSFMVANPPDIHILAPNADDYKEGASVLLHGAAWDMEDQYMAEDSLSWTSDVDGALGTGRLLVTTALTPGNHVITFTGIDDEGLQSSDDIEITVTPRETYPNPDLNDDGVVDGNDLSILLGQWSGFGLGDLNLDGTVDGGDLTILLGSWTL